MAKCPLPESFAAELESNFYVATQNEEIIGLGALSYKEKKIYAELVHMSLVFKPCLISRPLFQIIISMLLH
ncbi:hypothetical protein DXX94_02380 [Thalassotalea euphylliae]|uniref:Uncharacterized protein n=1 Tax=Thalassotalea euphylliae TaxID=1655234 RepID=A0A3E0TZ49_9GAMM|nr:hypothetical protein DXX94_02380 [Thalassotalea euphylliae]